MSAQAIEWSILAPAFMAGMLVLATHVPMGMQVLSRGIVFIDLAIAQIAGLGVIAADLLGWEPQGWAVQIAAVSAALLGSLMLTYTEKRWPEIQEALIGVLFVLAASGSIVLLANNPHGSEHLKDLLVGQILWVNYSQLLPACIISTIILAVWVMTRVGQGGGIFYGLFACAVTVSVQLVGIYLVFASLIIPALSTRNLKHGRLFAGYLVGISSYAAGLLVSALFDLPSGPIIVLVMAAIAIVGASLIFNRQ